MQAIITDNQEKIVELCRTHHVKRLCAFGSAVRDDFDPEKSDIDLLVEFYELPFPDSFHNKAELEERLVRLFARPVDLIRDAPIRNPYLRREIEGDRQLLYAA